MNADWFHFLSDAVGEILRDGNPETFLAWMQTEGVDGARRAMPRAQRPQPGSGEEAARRRLATALAFAIWNALPQPRRGFRPEPLPGPERNSPCPCGSGTKFKKCCGAEVPRLPALEPFEIWLALIDRLGEAELTALAATRALPPELLGELARTFLRAGGPESTLALLEPFLAATALLPERFEEIVDPFLDAASSLDAEERVALLASVRERLPRGSRAALELRLASDAIDEGELDKGREALARAAADDPEHPGLGTLEVQHLVAGERFDEAKERAREWSARLARQGVRPEESPRPFLSRAAEDPERAVALFAGRVPPELLEQLAERVHAAAARPVAPLPVRPDDDRPAEGALETPAALLEVEARWAELWPLVKPRGTQTVAEWEDDDPWSRDRAVAWLAFLARHGEAFDSLSVLDDLVLGLDTLEQAQMPWVDRALLAPLLARAAAIVECSLAATSVGLLPWAEPANRPALRLAVEPVFLHLRTDRLEEAATAMERYLAWNPSDDHELRGDLAMVRLRRGENAAALAVAERSDDADLPEISYGRVLALLRLGRRDEAEKALEGALAAQPHVPHALLEPTEDPPEPDEDTEGEHVHGPHCAHAYADEPGFHDGDDEDDEDDGEAEEEIEGDEADEELDDEEELDDDTFEMPTVERGSPLEAWYYAEEARELWSIPADALDWLASHSLPRA